MVSFQKIECLSNCCYYLKNYKKYTQQFFYYFPTYFQFLNKGITFGLYTSLCYDKNTVSLNNEVVVQNVFKVQGKTF